MFNIASPDAGGRMHCAWVEIDEPNADYVVRFFDLTTDAVDVEHRGLRFTLKLKRYRVQQLAPSEPPPPSGAVNATVDPAGRTRLDNIAAEIRRRRSLRQASVESGNAIQP